MQVNEFNRNNRWKKRGINVLPMVYPMYYSSYRYNVLVAINHNDGSVSVSHGGIECGQGINTKVRTKHGNKYVNNKLFILFFPTNLR